MKPISLKEQAINLRLKGDSYNMIAQELGLAKSTLSDWLREVPFIPNEQVIERIGRAKLKSAQFKNFQRIKDIEKMRKVAHDELRKLSKRDLWLLGIGLYLGEGSKNNENIRIINADAKIIKLSIKWFREICDLKTENFAPCIHIYPDNDPDLTLRYWSNELNIPLQQFGKTQIDMRRDKNLKKRGKLPYGTLHLYVRSCGDKKFGRSLHRRIMGWIEVCTESNKYKNASVV